MAVSLATPFKGTLLKMDPSGSTAHSNHTTVAEVVSIDGPGLTRDMIEVTHTLSANDLKEYKRGLADSGEVTFDMNFLPGTTAGASQIVLTTAIQATIGTTVPAFSVHWTDADSTVWTFNGEPTNFSPSGTLDGQLQATCTIKIASDKVTIGT